MMDNNNGMSCQVGCWALAAGIGALTFVLLLVLGNFGFIASAFLGGIVFAILGALLSWLFCTDLPKMGEARIVPNGAASTKPTTAAAQTSGAHASSAPAPKPAAPAKEPAAEPAKTAPTTAKEASASSEASTLLSGEEELANRKGDWKYEGDASAEKPAKAATAPASSSEGKRPEGLSEARGGQADDLKRIKGIGPKLETLCNTLGFYHFDQIANWGADEVAWVDQNLEGFKGRVTRDDWVEQAKLLAAGGETQFSKKVDKGDVY
ncbi:endonuclease [Primorskyibacter sp. S187A]|uniref:endonuclease n=1 Tax=Primorskyibacter sp. S187A TaxID=3415130 RepID=UPI003C7AE672